MAAYTVLPEVSSLSVALLLQPRHLVCENRVLRRFLSGLLVAFVRHHVIGQTSALCTHKCPIWTVADAPDVDLATAHIGGSASGYQPGFA